MKKYNYASMVQITAIMTIDCHFFTELKDDFMKTILT